MCSGPYSSTYSGAAVEARDGDFPHTLDTARAHSRNLTFRAGIWPWERAERVEVALV